MRRSLAPAALFALACNRPVDSSEITPPVTTTSVPNSGILNPPFSCADVTAKVQSAKWSTSQATEAASIQGRLSAAVLRAGVGTSIARGPVGWNVADPEPVQVMSLPAGPERCVRAVALSDTSGQSARLSIWDDRGRILAAESGEEVIFAPADGPLCIPSQTALVVRIAAEQRPLTGLAVILEAR